MLLRRLFTHAAHDQEAQSALKQRLMMVGEYAKSEQAMTTNI